MEVRCRKFVMVMGWWCSNTCEWLDGEDRATEEDDLETTVLKFLATLPPVNVYGVTEDYGRVIKVYYRK